MADVRRDPGRGSCRPVAWRFPLQGPESGRKRADGVPARGQDLRGNLPDRLGVQYDWKPRPRRARTGAPMRPTHDRPLPGCPLQRGGGHPAPGSLLVERFHDLDGRATLEHRAALGQLDGMIGRVGPDDRTAPRAGRVVADRAIRRDPLGPAGRVAATHDRGTRLREPVSQASAWPPPRGSRASRRRGTRARTSPWSCLLHLCRRPVIVAGRHAHDERPGSETTGCAGRFSRRQSPAPGPCPRAGRRWSRCPRRCASRHRPRRPPRAARG